MREFGITVITILAIVGLCAILGIATRGTEKKKEDRDNPFLLLTRGLGTLMAVFISLVAIGIIIYIITLPFQ